MKLYYSPGACSLAGHIALHEADMKFELVKVDLKTHKLGDGRSFKEINPKGSVPALEFDDGDILTENIAILSHIADQYPALAVPGKRGRDRLLEMLATCRRSCTRRSPRCSTPTRPTSTSSRPPTRSAKSSPSS
jgi:glutathione S-transferase